VDSVVKVRAVLEQEEDGAWSAWVPALPGCATWGQTREEAVAHLREAVRLYVESLRERGLPVPAAAREIAVENLEVPV
jgi:antitoxin HicB